MKKALYTIALLSIFISHFSYANAVWVNGYYRSNGTYVNGYERTAPDGNPYNNYGYPGNYNPNTGSITGGNPDTYLKNYYNNSAGSGGSTNYNGYDYSYPTTPTCPINSYYDGISSCKCNYGYVVSGTSCVSADSLCNDQIGYSSSYDSLNNTCKCNSGYVIGTSGQCTSASSFCINKLGLMSQYNSLSKTCECMIGYEFDGSSCVYKETTYFMPTKTNNQICQDSFGLNSNWNGTKNSDSQLNCVCQSGYQFNNTKTACIITPTTSCPSNSTLIGQSCICNSGTVSKNNQCISYTEDCRLSFGDNVMGTVGLNNNSSCNCALDYEWNAAKTACILTTIKKNVSSSQYNGATIFYSSLQNGSSGVEVNLLQTFLKKKGIYNSDITGYYGPKTRTAVMSFQALHNITPTGTVGPKTRSALNNSLGAQN